MSIQKWLLEGERPKPLPGKLIYVTTSLYEGDWKSIRHSHHFAELFYVKSGSGQFVVEDQILPITTGDLIMTNPNVEHTEFSYDVQPLEYIALGVEDLKFSFHDKKDYLFLSALGGRREFHRYFLMILEEAEKKDPGYELVCQDLLEILTLHLSRHVDSTFEIIPVRNNANKECSRIRRFIESNYQDDITLDTLSEMAHLNKYYFVHAFTKFYGQSPMSYLVQKRIQTSQELLVTTDHSISDIARLTGFSSSSYFSQCFRKCCGMTAQEYRRQKASMP